MIKSIELARKKGFHHKFDFAMSRIWLTEDSHEMVDYIGDDFDDFYLGETNSDIHKILTVDLEQALKVDKNE